VIDKPELLEGEFKEGAPLPKVVFGGVECEGNMVVMLSSTIVEAGGGIGSVMANDWCSWLRRNQWGLLWRGAAEARDWIRKNKADTM
jgi:hypothetical protein